MVTAIWQWLNPVKRAFFALLHYMSQYKQVGLTEAKTESIRKL